MTKRKLRYSGLGLAVLTVGAIAACSSDNTGTPAAGGTTGTAGAHSGGAGTGTAGTGTAGTGTAGTGTAGTGTAGTGTAGTGGSTGYACAGTIPTAALITDFSNLVASTTSTGNYTFAGGVLGGTYNYQPAALTLDTLTNTVLNVKGNVKNYDGFGLYFNTCYDASAYTGISFSIKGYAGPKGKLNFRVQTNSNTAIDMTNMKGQCVSTAADTYNDCHASAFDVPVTATATVVTVSWSQLTGGVPVAAVTGNNIVGLEWAFDWTPGATGTAGTGAGGASGGSGGASAGSGGASAGSGGKGGAGGASAGTGGASGGSGGAAPAAGPYDADVTIDDIKFLGGPPAGGAGGAGGASGGSGGASAGSGGASAGSAGKGGASGSGGKGGSGGA